MDEMFPVCDWKQFPTTPGLLATDIHIQIQTILTINLSEHVLNGSELGLFRTIQNMFRKVYGQNNLNMDIYHTFSVSDRPDTGLRNHPV